MNTIPNQQIRRELGWGLLDYEFDPGRYQVEIARQSFASFAACPLSATGTKLAAKAEASIDGEHKTDRT